MCWNASQEDDCRVVACCLVEPKESRVPVRLLNPKSAAVKITAGATVATIETIACAPGLFLSGVELGPNELSSEKAEMIEQLVNTDETSLSEQEREQFHSLLVRYSDIFSCTKSDTGRTDQLLHKINQIILYMCARLFHHRVEK